MEVRKYGNQNVLIADEGKHIRSVNDEYVPATENEPERIPSYSSIIFLAVNTDLNKINELYIEENIKEV